MYVCRHVDTQERIQILYVGMQQSTWYPYVELLLLRRPQQTCPRALSPLDSSTSPPPGTIIVLVIVL